MELERIKILVDKYFEGTTTLEEEQLLAQYFRTHDDIPEEYVAIKAMFDSFATLRETTPARKVDTAVVSKREKSGFTLNYRWASSIAAAVVIGIGLFILLKPNNEDLASIPTAEPEFVCHIDGVMIEDREVAYAEADRILANVSNDLKLAMVEIDNITHYTQLK